MNYLTNTSTELGPQLLLLSTGKARYNYSTAMVSASTVSVVGVLLLSLLSLSMADIYPGDGGFQVICQEIIDDVAGNLITFRELVPCTGSSCSNQLQVREYLTRASLCNRLTAQHNSKNAAYLGGATVSSSQCQAALNAPAFYGTTEWNNWSGRHCGTWRSTDSSGTVTQTFTDHALWNTAALSGGFARQTVTFLTRSCCTEGWNESGGTVSQLMSLASKCVYPRIM